MTGRPFVIEHEMRRAPAELRTDWCDQASSIAGFGTETDIDLDDATRVLLAKAWLDDALIEHASIASFARLTLHLLAVGAPPDLTIDAQRASLDEVRHARVCFTLAQRYGATTLGPGPLAIDSALATPDLIELAVAAVHEGCVNETIAALIAAEQSRAARDPAVKEALAAIAEDEVRHAELAWRTLVFAISRAGDVVRDAAREAFESALARIESAPASRPSEGKEPEHIDPAVWRACGRLTALELDQIAKRAAKEVIAPCVRVLLASSTLAKGFGTACHRAGLSLVGA